MAEPRALRYMNAGRWQQIKSIVASAADAEKEDRTRLLENACGGDPELRSEVESLLAAAEGAESLPDMRAAIASASGAFLADQDTALRRKLDGVLGHQYEIIRMLGRGGMGCVFLARERALDRFVAIKILNPDMAGAEGNRERFRREARTAARLSHPGILGLHTFGEIDDLWYLVMTYVRGETLAEKIRREGVFPWQEAHRIFLEMAAALDCAHRHGVIHRDIKPANILLDSESGHSILADFGIAKMPGAADSLTATGAVLGTPDYMSPEQVTGASDLDERSDIYSLGAVAYFMLTGREPFRSDTHFNTLYRRVIEDPVSVDTIVPSIPPELSAAVRKSMARERSERWENAASLVQALESIDAGDHLPEVVRHMRSFGSYALLWAVGWLGFAFVTERSNSERALLIFVALLVPVALLLHLWNGAGKGKRLVDLVRVASSPPEWWTVWWPAALRRPSDLWRRLPVAAKGVRILITASFPALFLLVLLKGRISPAGTQESWVDIAQWGTVALAMIVVAAGLIWTRQRGLALDQSLRMLLGPTLPSPGWNEPAVTRLLAPASGAVREPDPGIPSDLLRAIRELVALVPAARGDAGMRTATAAERLLKAIDARDRKLAAFDRDAGPDEANRLASQLDSLGAGGPGDTRERAELRELVRHQLDLVRRMQSGREEVLRERARMADLLKALWMLLRAAGDSRDGDSGAADRLKSMCAEISLELERIEATDLREPAA